MKTLKQYIHEAREKGVAIGHFNISNLETLNAVFNAAKKLNVPVIIGVSEGEREFMGINQVVALVRSFKEEYNYPIFLNADHTYSFEKVKEAIDSGFDSVIYDGAKGSMEDNIKVTNQCVEYARSCGREVLVEAELGYIGQSSKILDGIPDGIEVTSVSDAKHFVSETGIDLFAPAVGNIHGMLKDVPEPRLDIRRIEEISKAVNVPLVLHGASGNSKEDVQSAIKKGVAIVHINTEIRVAFKNALEKSLHDNPNEVAPYKIMKPDIEAVEKVVEDKLKSYYFID